MFFVTGSVYTDMSFTTLEPGEKPLRLGPFRTYDEAHKAWFAIASRTLDICCAKYWIEGAEDARREGRKALPDREMVSSA